ncbi:hypothetical protein THRCLA_10488, partial [Thraustotheca clavata]
FALLPNAITSISSSNGCLAYNAASNSVGVTKCTDAANQAWVFDAISKRIKLPSANVCLVSNAASLGASPTVATCSSGALNQYFDNCDNVVSQNYIKLVTKRNTAVYEYYTGLYAGSIVDDLNHLFIYSQTYQTLQVMSNGQCLDAFPSGSGYGLHTHSCDGTNGNQKWVIDSANHKIKHATHYNLCLDVDPNSPINAAQVWTCYPNSDNQYITTVAY